MRKGTLAMLLGVIIVGGLGLLTMIYYQLSGKQLW